MSKSILVIDTPENCENCPFCRGWNVCKIMKYLKKEKIISVYTVDHQIFEGGKPDWCPIKDLPEKASHPDYCDNGRYDKGWNECIDKIVKSGINE